MNLSRFAVDRYEASDNFFQPFSKCSDTSSVFIPSKLFKHKKETGDVIPYKLSEVCDDKNVDKERQRLYDLYETVGKVFNQMVREQLYISEKYSSYLLWSFLIYGGIDGMLSSPFVALEDLESAIKEIDIDYSGTLKNMKNDPLYSKEYLFQEFLIPSVFEPRLEALNAIKQGFEIFPISPMLQLFTKNQLRETFFGYDLVLPSVVEKLLDFTPTETSPKPTNEFIDVFRQAILMMEITGCDENEHPYNDTIDFIEYVTGSRVAGFGTSLKIHVMEVKEHEQEKYPLYPLPKASTCFSQIYIPYVNDHRWTPENVLKNLRQGFPWIQSGFDDDFFIRSADNADANNGQINRSISTSSSINIRFNNNESIFDSADTSNDNIENGYYEYNNDDNDFDM